MQALTFNDVTLSMIDRDGEQWLTVRDIARALYPYKGYPQSDTPFEKRVLKLYGRHKEEFTSNMTSLIDVQTSGGIQKIRVFSLRGAHLLGMLARSERAKQFRRWVLDLIEQHKKEIDALQTEYHQAIVAYEIGRETASIHGKGLNQWKKRRPNMTKRVQLAMQKIQPDLFIQQF